MRVLVTGAGGMLGREAVRRLQDRGHDAIACDRHALDVTSADDVARVLARERPHAVLHCAAFTAVDTAEAQAAAAERVNVAGTANVARGAAAAGARLMYVSSDYVFDGLAREPYRPDSATNPLSAYGRTKLAGESAAQQSGDALIARTSWVYGREGTNFASRALARARAGEPLTAISDQRSIPTWVNDAAEIMIRLLEESAPAGIYHVSNSGSASWYEWAGEAVALAHLDVEVRPVHVADLPLPAARPRYSVLDVTATERLVGPIRSWRDALAAAVEDGL